ncbi:MAG: hypothetical protein KBA97_11405 [Methanothrix sp.]|nr:hypothetical protein [Methanothrix sp.]
MKYLLISFVLAALLMLCSVEAASGPDYMALADLQRAEGNYSRALPDYDGFIFYARGGDTASYADLSNATDPGMKVSISPGKYESTRYDIPVGPYEVSFERRSPLDVFGVKYYTFNESKGDGTDYRMAQFEQFVVYSGKYDGDYVKSPESSPAEGEVADSDGVPVRETKEVPHSAVDLYILITRQIGPGAPFRPDGASVHMPFKTWNMIGPETITIDGNPGIEEIWYYDMEASVNYNNDYYIDEYNLSSDSFVMLIQHKGDVNKDLALVRDTLHVEKQR